MADGTSALGLGAGDGFEQAMEPEPPPFSATAAYGVPSFLVPKSLGEVKELAKMIALAEWAPDCYRDLDGNYLQPKIELAILQGATVGLGPIAAVHAIAVIGATPSIWGDGALSVIEHSGLLEDMVEDYEVDDDEGLTAICTMKRRHRATPIVTRFSMAMAERAGLTRSEGPWQTYPERMLRMRARSWTMRDAFADVLRGLQLREEVEDYVGNRGGRLGHAPHRDVSFQGSPHHHSSPRPSRPAASDGAGRPNDRPTATLLSPSRHGEDRPIAEALLPAGELYTLVDADGCFIEVASPDGLLAGFERLFLDKHLSPDQIVGVWESNEQARRMIERLFGADALTRAQEHLHSVQRTRERPSDDVAEPTAPSHSFSTVNDGSGPDHLSEPDRALVLAIQPTWGIQKIFQQYRAALSAFCDDSANGKLAVARFRQANIGVERRLRGKLPSRMAPIDAMYQRAGLEP